LFIVSRETPYLVEYMRSQFVGEPEVEVVIDRRGGRDRRVASDGVSPNAPSRARERRTAPDRRQRRHVDQQLREAFHALVTVD
jgi:hypothetical protein